MKIKDKVLRYFEETKVELMKVTWPSKPEVTGSTIVVIVTSVIVSAFVYAVDMGLNVLVNFILSR